MSLMLMIESDLEGKRMLGLSTRSNIENGSLYLFLMFEVSVFVLFRLLILFVFLF